VFRPSTGTWYRKNVSSTHHWQVDYAFAYGISTDIPIVGDWNAG
jgi:hypothetical protein